MRRKAPPAPTTPPHPDNSCFRITILFFASKIRTQWAASSLCVEGIIALLERVAGGVGATEGPAGIGRDHRFAVGARACAQEAGPPTIGLSARTWLRPICNALERNEGGLTNVNILNAEREASQRRDALPRGPAFAQPPFACLLWWIQSLRRQSRDQRIPASMPSLATDMVGACFLAHRKLTMWE